MNKNRNKDNAGSFFCPNCGTKNLETSNYCMKCGFGLHAKTHSVKNEFVKKTPKNKSNKKHVQKRLALLDILQENKIMSVIGLIVLGFIAVQFFPNNKTIYTTKNYTPNNSVGLAGLTGSRLNNIASKFVCPCGSSSCGELSLEVCGCPSAREETAFIQKQINTNKSDVQIIKAISSKFGGMKPQFKNLLSSSDNLSDNSLKLKSNVTKLASMFDFSFITEQFKCPCGQCNIEELKDCGCNHPKGAHEVKGFIRDKINKNIYTTTQIIEQVNKTYGGKKI